MALCDLNSGKIIGAREGTLTYFHELAHLEFNKSDKGIKLNYWASVFHDFAITLMIFGLLSIFFMNESLIWLNVLIFIFSGLCWISYLLTNIYEEIWCWIYAKRLLKGGKQNG